MKKLILVLSLLLGGSLLQCGSDAPPRPRLSLFVGMDISGSFMRSGHFDDAIDFLAHYLYAHLNGLSGLDEPNVLFVGSIGGASEGEAKTLYPIQTFAGKSVAAIREQLEDIFPRREMNPFTDYNAFFEQVATTVKNRNLLLRPISIVMLSDGMPDVRKDDETDYRSIDVSPLERLARSVTIRLLYTDPVVGRNWQTRVPRKRVKIWTQDATVMSTWRDPQIFQPDTTLEAQDKLFSWIADNVDFGVRSQRVD